MNPWTNEFDWFKFQAEVGDADVADVEEADMASSEEGEGDEEEEDSSGQAKVGSFLEASTKIKARFNLSQSRVCHVTNFGD